MPASGTITKTVSYLLIFGVVVFVLMLASEFMDFAVEHIRGDVGD